MAPPRDPNLYSRFVRVTKFALPLLAIAALSTVFLVQQEDPFDGTLVFSDLDRKTLDDGLTIHNPQITGATQTGGRYRISARTAVPDNTDPNEIRFTALTARSQAADGRVTELVGDQGTAVVKTEVIRVEGNVVVTNAGGYEVTTDRAEFRVAAGALVTGPVVVTGPTGAIEAGSMRLEEHATGADGATKEFLFFDNGVTLVHQPQSGQ